jgi:hypothetical protein
MKPIPSSRTAVPLHWDNNPVYTVYLEDSWTENGDGEYIINYCARPDSKWQLQIISGNELKTIPSRDFFKSVVLAQSYVIQSHLILLNRQDLIPDTYDRAFRQWYQRPIEIITIQQLWDKYISAERPRFIKPTGIVKLFEGQVLEDSDDLTNLLVSKNGVTLETNVYSCPIIDINGELRLLIGTGRLYGVGQISIAPPPNQDWRSGFLDQLITAVGDRFLCVDIGWVAELGWIVIEINPPYALDEYDIPLFVYLVFMTDAFNWFRCKLSL